MSMINNESTSLDVKKEFFKSRMGIVGGSILVFLVLISIIALTTIPINTFQDWNNPSKWISYPKVAVPVWINYFLVEKIPEHVILEESNIQTNLNEDISIISHQFNTNFEYDTFPKDSSMNLLQNILEHH